MIVSLVGTTSIGYNLFLGGAMAQGKTIVEAQRGIAFSTVSAFLVSELILIIGAGYHSKLMGQEFKIQLLAHFIEPYVGKVGVGVFSTGFMAAALSSMAGCALGAAITADTLYSDAMDTDTDQSK